MNLESNINLGFFLSLPQKFMDFYMAEYLLALTEGATEEFAHSFAEVITKQVFETYQATWN